MALQKISQKKLNILLRLPIVSNLIKKKIQKGLGLSNAEYVFTGAAPTSTSIIKWFERLGITIQEAYAMTENTCYSHVSFKNKIIFLMECLNLLLEPFFVLLKKYKHQHSLQ